MDSDIFSYKGLGGMEVKTKLDITGQLKAAYVPVSGVNQVKEIRP